MEGLSYISCIKVNGVPILPPMMTKDIREEMSAYKQIAISLEKQLMALRDSRFKKRHCHSKENLIPFECNNINRNERNVMDTDDVSPETFESPDENAKQILPWNKHRSDTECTSDHQINIASNIYSRPGLIATSGVADNCQNGVSLTKPSTITTESEILKPQVPKTLNIIPLTLGNPNCGEDEKYQRNGLHNTEDIPKLVRQGSYVLDTPSPILLAHMKMELSSSTTDPCTEYVPTSCTNTVRRKEWNIAQAKMEWENESKSKHCIPVESFRISSKQTKNSDSYTTSQLCKSLSFQTQSEPFFVAYPFARSVDCIQTMLANENVNRSNVQMKYDRQYPMEYKDEKKQRFEKGKKYDSSFTSPSAYKHGVSLENLSSTDVPIYKYTESEDNTISTSNNFIKEIAKNIPTENSILNLKSSIASDKLLTVYKKVQEMHKKQMIELVSRQQREQLLLQKEFEKQQLLLLREIKKSFPEISVPLLTENISSTAFSQGTPNSEKHFENIDRSTENLKNLKSNLQEENEVTHLRENNASLIPCLLDYVYSEKNLCKPESCSSKSSLSIDTLEMESLHKTNNSVTMVAKEETETRLDVRRTNEKKLVEEGHEWKRLNVSRQLFPLDSKTIHVPVLDRTIYGSKHIEAATVINAYTRGYLIRRLMRTERVVALKNTYKEALHCMLKLHVDAPLNRSEISFLHRLQLQCDAASMNIVELFAQSPEKRMQVIAQDREIKQSRIERPMSARSYSFATQRTLARKKLKEMEEYQPTSFARSCSSRSRCQTWTSDVEEKLISPNILYHSIKRSTSAGTVRKPWR
ncbi:uncharacterized protein LOC128894884 [Hylaeus anthracinus]|uniref:uncharacterized protein LOC128894884 n=1 Tax=Hylaeus anthracinus TaxID=313031 RepID=UPI0023B9963C|nr:uncharacterized protein LOC128894884 [Hylaeus anthracinus]XP_054012908.1 uncharacterized protein LOC128894884 [Hylaeus anthracinus]XP_054012909.1 uncharacterized protein LOC128894884 [Hylaeus anthracinus]